MRPLALAIDGTLRRALAYAEGGRVVRLFAEKRPLYVRRDVLNAAKIVAWAKAASFKTTLAPEDMHVTVAYSREPVDWGAMGDSFDRLRSDSIEGRSVEFLGDKGGIVLKFRLPELSARWQELRDRGCSWDYEGYTPHVTLTYENPDGIDPETITPYTGAIELGPEKFEALDLDWADKVAEHAQKDLKPRLDALEAASLEALRDALGESRDALVTKVRKATDFAALVNDLKRLPRFGAVEMEVRGMLDRAREAGRKDLRREVRESRSFAFDPHQPRAPKGSEDGGQWKDDDFDGSSVDWSGASAVDKDVLTALASKVDGRVDGIPWRWTNKEAGWRTLSGSAHALHQLDVVKDKNEYLVYSGRKVGESKERARFLSDFTSLKGAFRYAKDYSNYLNGRAKRPESFGDRYYSQEHQDFADSSFKPKSALRWLRATAFWVSGILGDRVLADVKGIILNGLKTGTASSVMAEQIFDAFTPWLGDPDIIRDEQQLQPWRLETIVRTNTTTAYNHGRLSEIVDPEIARFVKGIRYSAILDERTTEVCNYLGKMNGGKGALFKPTDPNIEALLPPLHYSCRSIIVAIVAGEQVDASEFITPEQIGKARGLADAKFLTQASAAWKAYSEREDDEVVEKPKRKQKKATEFTVAKQADGALKITRTEVPDGEV